MDGEEIAIPLAPANNKYTGRETCDRFEIIYTYETPTVPATEVTVTYTVETDGRIHVQADYCGKQGLPELPVFGMRFLMPTQRRGIPMKDCPERPIRTVWQEEFPVCMKYRACR